MATNECLCWILSSFCMSFSNILWSYLFLCISYISFAFFFSFIQTRPYSVRHSTVYTNDNTLEIELYIVTNRFFVIHPDQYCKEIIQKHRRINKLSADTTYQIVLFANSWCFKKGYSCAEYEYRVDNDKIQLQK